MVFDESESGNRQLPELPTYVVENWSGQRQVISSSGIGRTSSDDGEITLTSIGVHHANEEAAITVTSHRPRDNGIAGLRRWLAHSANQTGMRGDGETKPQKPGLDQEVERGSSTVGSVWKTVTIAVDGSSTAFEIYQRDDDDWVAVGQAPDADLTLQSHGVPWMPLKLVRNTDLSIPARARRLERPKTPSRKYPVDVDDLEAVPDQVRVDLTFERHRLLSGSIGDQVVNLQLNVPTHNGEATGSFAGMPVSARWENGNNYTIYPDVPSDVKGSFAGLPVELHATFHLEPNYLFDRGTVSGNVGSDVLVAKVERASGGLNSTSTVAVDGMLGSTPFTIYAAIDGSLTRGEIRGTVGDSPIRIDATRTHAPDAPETHLEGVYIGPPVLLALVVGTFLHFI
jgi:hypothetical protein